VGVGFFSFASLAGCHFDSSTRFESGVGADDPEQGPDASFAVPDAGCSFASAMLCTQEEVGGVHPGWHVTSDTVFDTDEDPLCRVFPQDSGPEACLVLVESFTLAQGVDFRVVGARPLVLATPNSVELLGSFDVSSGRDERPGAGANYDACAAASAPEDDIGGAGGGAGGSFAGKGGDGGNGDTDSSLGLDGTGSGGAASSPVALPLVIRGGCAGSKGGDESDLLGSGDGGNGGNSGGAVSFIAGAEFRLSPESSIRATGAGGDGGDVQSGGGGGGTGGYVAIEARDIFQHGNISANGGGGGEGGHRLLSGPKDGNPGANGALQSNGAAGGSGAAANAGNGGLGSTQDNRDATPGLGASGGGGGGGGGAGFIVIKGNMSGGGLVSPTPTILN
jgi:hypothetical protein